MAGGCVARHAPRSAAAARSAGMSRGTSVTEPSGYAACSGAWLARSGRGRPSAPKTVPPLKIRPVAVLTKISWSENQTCCPVSSASRTAVSRLPHIASTIGCRSSPCCRSSPWSSSAVHSRSPTTALPARPCTRRIAYPPGGRIRGTDAACSASSASASVRSHSTGPLGVSTRLTRESVGRLMRAARASGSNSRRRCAATVPAAAPVRVRPWPSSCR